MMKGNLVRNSVLSLGRDLDRALNRELYVALDRGPDAHIVRDLVRDLTRARDGIGELVREVDRERDFALILPEVRGLVLVLSRARNLACARNLDRARDLAPDPDLDLDLECARELARPLEGYLAEASIPAVLSIPAAPSIAASSEGQPRVPTLLAGRLTTIAARLLPAVEQARYGEEFGSELAEIALAGGGRRAQLAYAARTVLSSAWQLRAALRSPRRRGAVQ